MDRESQEVWSRYVVHRAKMPTFRAMMLASEATGERSYERDWRSDRRLCALAMKSLASFESNPFSKELRKSLERIDPKVFTNQIFSDDWQLRPKEHFRELLVKAYAHWGFPAAPAQQECTPSLSCVMGTGPLLAELLSVHDRKHEPALRELYRVHGHQLLPLPSDWKNVVEGGCRYAVMLDGRLIGMFRVYECFGEATMAVLLEPQCRRSRIGTQAALWAAHIARERGWTFAYLDVYDDNLEAQELIVVTEHRPRRSRPETPDDLRVGTRPNEDADDSGGR